jgi:hypothetical protein
VANTTPKSNAKKTTGRTTPRGTRPPVSEAKGPRSGSTLDRLKSKKGLVRRLPVYLDSEVTAEFEDAKAAFDLLSNEMVRARTSDDEATAIVDRYKAAAEAMAENTVTMVIRRPIIRLVGEGEDERCLDHDEEPDEDDGPVRTLKGRLAYEWLMEAHPPTDEQKAEELERSGSEAPYNADTFAPALIAACVEDPAMSPADADEMLAEWTFTEAMTVFTTCMEVCTGTQIASLGKGYGGMTASTKN